MRRSHALVVGLALAFAGSVAEAQLAGGTMRLQYRFPGQGDVWADDGTAVVGGGLEWNHPSDGNFSVDVDNTGFTVHWVGCGPGCGYTGSSFNGIRLSDDGLTLASFLSVTHTGGTQNVNQGMVSWNNDEIYINWSGMSINENADARFEVLQGDVVPEPATVTLMATGLIGVIGVAARRRRKV